MRTQSSQAPRKRTWRRETAPSAMTIVLADAPAERLRTQAMLRQGARRSAHVSLCASSQATHTHTHRVTTGTWTCPIGANASAMPASVSSAAIRFCFSIFSSTLRHRNRRTEARFALPRFTHQIQSFFLGSRACAVPSPPPGAEGRGVTVGPGATLRDGRESRIRGWHKCSGMPLHAARLHSRGHEGSLCGNSWQLGATAGTKHSGTLLGALPKPSPPRADGLAPRGAARRCVECVRARAIPVFSTERKAR